MSPAGTGARRSSVTVSPKARSRFLSGAGITRSSFAWALSTAAAACAAVAGVVAGAVCHLFAGALGFSILLRTVPGLFNAMLLAGALYLAWIGWSLMGVKAEAAPPEDGLVSGVPFREPGDAAAHPVDRTGARSFWATFRQAAVTNLLNPKAYLFMLAIFPQFFRPEYGPLWMQAVALGLITAFTQTGVYGTLALLAGNARGWLATNPHKSTLMARVAGSVLILGAVVTAFQGLAQR